MNARATINWRRRKLALVLSATLLIGIIIGALSAGGSAYWLMRKGDSHASMRFFSYLDKAPEDGRITKSELQDVINSLLRRLDDNNNQLIERDELPHFAKHWRHVLLERVRQQGQLEAQQVREHFAQMFQDFDADGDLGVTKQEYRQGHKRMVFKTLDSNADASLSFEEFVTFELPRRPHHRRR